MRFLSVLVSVFVSVGSFAVTPAPLTANGMEQIVTLLVAGGLQIVAQNQQGKWLVRAVREQYEGERRIVEEEMRSEVEATRILAPAQRVAIVLSAKDRQEIRRDLRELAEGGKISGEEYVAAVSNLMAMDAGSVQTGGITIGQFSGYGSGGYSRGYYPRTGRARYFGAYSDAAASARYWADIRRQQAEWGR
jgi:hypothetical protein